MGPGDDIARSIDLLRSAGLWSIRSRRAGRAAHFGAMGRQHHRSARRARQPRSSTAGEQRRIDGSRTVRSDTPVPHNRAGRSRGLRGSAGRARAPRGSLGILARHGRVVGHGSVPTCDQSGYAVERGDSGDMGPTRTPGGKSRDRCSRAAARDRSRRAGRASHNSCANARPPTHRLVVSAGVGQVRRRSHIGREIR